MARGATRKAIKRRAKKNKPGGLFGPRFDQPTPEAYQFGDFERAGAAYRRRPVIDALMERGVISARQYAAMGRYRDLFDLQDQSAVRDSCDKLVDPLRGGCGSAEARMDALIDGGWGLAYLECELGSLVHIARAVIGRDTTLSQWAIEQGGAKERRVFVSGKLVATYWEAKTLPLKNATMDIRMVGERLDAALSA